MEASTPNRNMDRRKLLKGGLAAGGAAYVAPQIVRTAVAGAQTTTCYAVKYEPGCTTLGPNGDPGCPAGMNNEIASALGGNTNAGCPAPVTISGGVGSANATVTVPANCQILFLGFKAGREQSGGGCYWVGPGGAGQSGTDPGASVSLGGSITSPAADISHITIVVCCTGSVI